MADAPPPPSPSSGGAHGPSAGADRHLADLAELAQQAVSRRLSSSVKWWPRQQLAWFGEQGRGRKQKRPRAQAGEPGLKARPESVDGAAKAAPN